MDRLRKKENVFVRTGLLPPLATLRSAQRRGAERLRIDRVPGRRRAVSARGGPRFQPTAGREKTGQPAAARQDRRNLRELDSVNSHQVDRAPAKCHSVDRCVEAFASGSAGRTGDQQGLPTGTKAEPDLKLAHSSKQGTGVAIAGSQYPAEVTPSSSVGASRVLLPISECQVHFPRSANRSSSEYF
jgi:hypothetical protein